MYHRQRWIGLLILAALLLCACQPIVAQPQAAAQPSDEDVTAAVTAEIDALFTEYGESLAADDAERWIQLWVEDGVQLPPGAPPNIGRDVIFAGISGAMEQYGYRDMDIQLDEVLLAGDLAIARGMYTVNLAPRERR